VKTLVEIELSLTLRAAFSVGLIASRNWTEKQVKVRSVGCQRRRPFFFLSLSPGFLLEALNLANPIAPLWTAALTRLLVNTPVQQTRNPDWPIHSISTKDKPFNTSFQQN
jgi:hypothetical protein